MSAQHTPGPWEVGSNGCYELALIAPNVGRTVAYAAWTGGSGCELQIENESDARLIVSAPDMFAALEGLQGSLNSAESNASGNSEWGVVSARINAARTAIAKAKGAPA